MFKAILLILILAAFAFGQKLPKEFGIDYNKFNDVTEVEFLSFDGLRSRSQRFDWILSFTHPGKELTKDIGEFDLVLSGKCSSYFCFDEDDTLIFFIDGERQASASKPNITISRDHTSFTLSRREWTQLANAKTVEFQIGIFQFTLKPKEIANFKTMLDLGTVKK